MPRAALFFGYESLNLLVGVADNHAVLVIEYKISSARTVFKIDADVALDERLKSAWPHRKIVPSERSQAIGVDEHHPKARHSSAHGDHQPIAAKSHSGTLARQKAACLARADSQAFAGGRGKRVNIGLIAVAMDRSLTLRGKAGIRRNAAGQGGRHKRRIPKRPSFTCSIESDDGGAFCVGSVPPQQAANAEQNQQS